MFTVGLACTIHTHIHVHMYITSLTRHWPASTAGIQSLQVETTKPAAASVQHVQTQMFTLCLIHTKVTEQVTEVKGEKC